MIENLTKVICPSCKFFFDDDGFNAGEPCPLSCGATLVSRVYVPQEAVARARGEGSADAIGRIKKHMDAVADTNSIMDGWDAWNELFDKLGEMQSATAQPPPEPTQRCKCPCGCEQLADDNDAEFCRDCYSDYMGIVQDDEPAVGPI